MVFLAPFRAVMSQKKPAPLTSKEMELRNKVFKLHPHERPILLPWNFGSEPQFETVER